jgi:hypothetical protein
MTEFVFKFETKEFSVEKTFDPRYNPILRMNNDTSEDRKKIVKAVFEDNGEEILSNWAKQSVHAGRWIETFKSRFPKENWYGLALFKEFYLNASDVQFSQRAGGTYSCRKYASLSEQFVTEFLNVLSSDYSFAKALSPVSGVFGSFINFATGKNPITGRKPTYLSDLLEATKVGVDYSIEATTIENSHGVTELSTMRIKMPLLYANRKELYKKFEYSTNIIDTVGWSRPSEIVSESLFGVELEVSTDYSEANIIDAFPEIFAIVKKDSTITGTKSNMGEIVTIPATLRTHRKMWMNFFKNLNEDMFDCLDKHNNGMHVHIDRETFDKDTMHLKKFCWFFANPANHKFLQDISERSQDSINKFAKFVSAPKISKTVPGKTAAGLSFVNSDRALRQSDKHTVVNLGKSATVEVRLFKGIVSYASIVKNLEFVDSLVEFSRWNNYKDMNLSSYIKWLKKLHTTKYRVLKLIIEEMDLDAILLEAEIEKVIKGSGLSTSSIALELNKMNLNNKFSKIAIKLFNGTYEASGKTLEKDDRPGAQFVVVAKGTRFAKYNDIAFAMQNGTYRR